MNYPSGSFPPSSSFIPPSSRDSVSETPPAYSNALRTIPNFPSNVQFVHPDLGILAGEMESPVNTLTHCPSSENYTLSAADWPGQLMRSTMPLNASINTGHFSPATCYEPYSGSDVSASPLSYCGPQTMSSSPSRGSILDFGAHHDVLGAHAHASHFWPHTPGCDADARVKNDPDIDNQEARYLGHAGIATAATFTPATQLGTNPLSPRPESLGENSVSTQAEVDFNVERTVDYNLPMEPPLFPAEIPSASGLQCNICGAQFTRRSNCREHMKRHDPSSRKSYPCENCAKTFGRKTDLKRHIDSVHRGLRRFGCQQCGYHFSRQDTLARHVADGCRRRSRRSSNSSRTEAQLLSAEETEPFSNRVDRNRAMPEKTNIGRQ